MAELLITGAFRSGTTLLSKLLTFHPRLLLAADAYLFFFRQLRNYWYQQKAEGSWDPQGPMADLFLDPQHAANRAIWEGDLTPPALPRMAGEIDDTTSGLHPDLVARIPQVSGNTFADYFRNLLGLLPMVYGGEKRDLEYVGMKMAWLEVFIPALMRTFPAFRAIIIIRDIRAIVASQNQKGATRPLLFYARHWRKSVACAHYLKHHSPFGERVHVIRYEDLVRDSEKHLREISVFLGVTFDPVMLKVGETPDETGRQWAANTSYGAGAGIFPSSIDKWQQVLSEDVVRSLELLCSPEMRLMGYRPQGEPLSWSELLSNSPEPPSASLVEWIRDTDAAAHLEDFSRYSAEVAKELLRHELLHQSARCLTPEVLSHFFIFPEVYAALRFAGASRLEEQ